MYEAFLTSFKTIDENIIDEVKLISNINLKIITYVFFPMILPFIITTFIQSFGLGLKVMVMAEFIAQPENTIGHKMLQERIYMNTSNIFAWTIIIIIFVMLFEILIKKIKIYYHL